MLSIFAAIILTTFVVGAALYLWFRSIMADAADKLFVIHTDLVWATDCIDEDDTRELVSRACSSIMDLNVKLTK